MQVPEDWLERHYDLLIVGGGINGAAIARDAALRGLSVLLLEADDWGCGTSAKSSKLAHGGLRYLEQMEFGLVHEALQDRERLLRQAPHLVRPMRFLYPIYPDIVARRAVRAGLLLYDVLSHGKTVPSRDWLPRDEAIRQAPYLRRDGLTGAAAYHDAQIDHVERLVLENVMDAHDAGAVVRNHTRVLSLLRDGARITGVRIRFRRREADVHAHLVINAAGPWVDEIAEQASARTTPLVRRTKGIHIAVPRFLDDALLVRAQDGRVFFVVPWHETCYIGTTDTDFDGDPAEAQATDADVAYLQEAARRYLPEAPLDDVLYTWAGVRALVNEEGLTESNVTRRHLVHDHADDGAPGMLTLQGGKITTARTLAEEVVTRACRLLGRRADAKRRPTRERPYPGCPEGPWEAFRAAAVARCTGMGLDEDIAAHLVDTYGRHWEDVLAVASADEGRRRLRKGRPFIACEVDWAVLREQATSLSDVMLRRTTLGLAPDGDPRAARRVSRRMAHLLGWGPLRRRRELDAYAKAARLLAVPG